MTNGSDPARLFGEFWELWVRLVADARLPGTIVVVEGERDRRAIRRLGLDGPVVLVHRGHTLAETAQHLSGAGRRVIVLTDWDREGGHFARRLHEFLGGERSVVDLDYRRRFSRLLRGELAHVEGLYGWAARTAERSGLSLPALLEAAEADNATTG